MKIGYDHTEIEFNPPAERLLGVLLPNAVEVERTGAAAVEYALDHPIGDKKVEEKVTPGEKVCIIASDITRPMPSAIALPPLIKRLNAAGIPDDDIVIVFGLGSHRRHTEEEKKYLVGELYGRIECIDSDPDDVVRLGVTKHGTPVDIFRRVVESDFIICTGNIEYHYFAGYSGGAKAVMPGVSTPAAIRVNHSMMVGADAYAGNIFSPVRADIEEAGDILGIDYILNAVLDEHKRIIYAVAGDVTAAHRDGAAFLDKLYRVPLRRRADIVVVSPGGYPKDQNMYQAQKALDNSKHAVRDGGTIIWVAGCKEGLGSALFEKWMTEYTPDQMIENIKRDFKLGAHKAAAIALVMKKADIYLVSELDDELVTSMGFKPFKSLDDAFLAATSAQGDDSKIYVMPYGGSTLPIFEG